MIYTGGRQVLHFITAVIITAIFIIVDKGMAVYVHLLNPLFYRLRVIWLWLNGLRSEIVLRPA